MNAVLNCLFCYCEFCDDYCINFIVEYLNLVKVNVCDVRVLIDPYVYIPLN